MSAAAPLRGLVLAGGRSERMGTDKAGIRFEGVTLLDRAVALLLAVVADVWVAVRADQLDDPVRTAYKLVADQQNGIGPGAGLLAAHAHYPESAWLVIACDMPLLDAGTLAELVAARDPESPATAWTVSTDGLPEPLCAIYEPVTLAAFRSHVAAGGRPGLRAWLQAYPPKLLTASAKHEFISANTREELKSLSAVAHIPANRKLHDGK